MTLFYILLLSFALAVSFVVSFALVRRRRVVSNLLREGKLDQALQLISSPKKKQLLARRLLDEGQVAQGLHVYQRIDDHAYIQQYIYNQLEIPGKFIEVEVKGWIFTRKEKRRSETADLLYEAANKLLALKHNVNDLRNPYIPEGLKTDIRIGLDDGFYILWDTCHRLSLVQTQGLPVEEWSLQAARADIRKLIEISNQAQKELGQLTLERDPTRMKMYQETFRRFSEEAHEIREAKRLL